MVCACTRMDGHSGSVRRMFPFVCMFPPARANQSSVPAHPLSVIVPRASSIASSSAAPCKQCRLLFSQIRQAARQLDVQKPPANADATNAAGGCTSGLGRFLTLRMSARRGEFLHYSSDILTPAEISGTYAGGCELRQPFPHARLNTRKYSLTYTL